MKKTVVLTGDIVTNGESSRENGKAVCIEDGLFTGLLDLDGYHPPAGADVVDWRDYAVIPGLVDCHDHLGLETGDEHAQALEHDFTNVLRGVYNARRLLASGITTLRSVGEKNYMDVYWRDAINTGWMQGPRLVICGKFIMRTGGHAWYLGREADGPEQIRTAVREQIKQGADAIKIMITGGSSTPGSVPTIADYTDEEIAAAVEEAHRFGRKIAAHVHGGDGARVAINAGIDSIEHGVYLTEEDLALMAKRGTFLCQTYGVYTAAATSEETPAFMRENCSRAAKLYLSTLASARKHGVKVVFGGDTHHAKPVTEFKALIEAGFTPLEALRAGTINAAELLGLKGRIGAVVSGGFADLVALKKNPLDYPEALGEVVAVMKEGIVYNPAEL
jgi:imidazolonepropionase-like amidohydrolase